MTGEVSKDDMHGTIRIYNALLDTLGFNVYLEPDEWDYSGAGWNGYVCAVTARYADNPTSRLLWWGSGATQQNAREYMLRQAHRDGMPLAFSEAEAKMQIAIAGEEAFRPACKKIEMFAGEFEGRW